LRTARASRAREAEPARSREQSFTKKAVIASAVAAAAVVALWMLLQVVHVLLMTFAGVLVAIFLWHVAKEVAERTPLEIGASLLLVVILLFTALGATILVGGPSLYREGEHVVQAIPPALDSLQQEILKLPWGDRLLSLIWRSPDVAGGAAATVTTGISRVIAFVAYAFIVVFVGIYVAHAPDLHWNGLMHLFPPEERKRAREVLLDIRDNLWWWSLGRAFSMAAVGVSTALGLWLLGVPSAGVLGLLAGLLDFIPNFGPLLSLVPAILVAMPDGPRTVLLVALLYMGIQFAEWAFLTPYVDRKSVSVPPALVLVSQVLAGVLFGVLGALLATPLTVTAMVLVKRLYVEDYLNDSIEESPARG
jgi:predicted PurR-regulated permease PerM